MNTQPVDTGIRLATMILDHFFMTFIAMLFYLPVMFTNMATSFTISHDQDDFNIMGGPMMYIGLFGFALYFCKDIFNGRSLAKRILRLQLIDNKTGQVASPIQCLVRDLFCIIWPIEAIVALVNPGRRIGDRIAGTRLVYYDPATHSAKLNIGKIIISLVIAYGIVCMIPQLLPDIEFAKANYSKTSYNEAASKELGQLISEHVGDYVKPDIRIYDTVANSNLKYISAIINLQENYLENEGSYRRLHEMTTKIIYDRHAKESFTGRIRYVYRGAGQFQSRSTSIGSN